MREEDIVDISNFRRWTEAEDDLLMKMVDGPGHKWSVIGMHMNRTGAEIRNRHRTITQRRANDELRNILTSTPRLAPVYQERQALPVPIFTRVGTF